MIFLLPHRRYSDDFWTLLGCFQNFVGESSIFRRIADASSRRRVFHKLLGAILTDSLAKKVLAKQYLSVQSAYAPLGNLRQHEDSHDSYQDVSREPVSDEPL